MREELKNNHCSISGEVKTLPIFSHSVKDENFYTFCIGTKRLSGQIDTLPIIVNSRLLEGLELLVGQEVSVSGEYRSANKIIDGKSKLVLSVFAKLINIGDNNPLNKIELKGYICKNPTYRVTPFNREITDVLLAVNRDFGKSDYIPCIMWGRNAELTRNLPIGSPLKILGRIQSREYNKWNDITKTSETLVAYEVSVSEIVVEEA